MRHIFRFLIATALLWELTLCYNLTEAALIAAGY
jgi:hypothetical protein